MYNIDDLIIYQDSLGFNKLTKSGFRFEWFIDINGIGNVFSSRVGNEIRIPPN